MGDAGPLSPLPDEFDVEGHPHEHETSLREVTVLVTGFGVCFSSLRNIPSATVAV